MKKESSLEPIGGLHFREAKPDPAEQGGRTSIEALPVSLIRPFVLLAFSIVTRILNARIENTRFLRPQGGKSAKQQIQPTTDVKRRKPRKLMAYIIGILSETEQEELERRGWAIENCPPIQSENISNPLPEGDGRAMKMCWVDSDMYQVMTGPDWESAPEHKRLDQGTASA